MTKRLAKKYKSDKKSPVSDFFASKVLAISLIIIISVFALIGTVIPQADTFSQEELLLYDSQNTAISYINRIVSVLQIADRDPFRSSIYAVYHSWWFAGAVILLAVNLITCSVKRLPLIADVYRSFEGKVPAEENDARGAIIKFDIKTNIGDCIAAMREWGRGKFRVVEEALGREGAVFRFQKHRFNRLGYMVVHLGLLVVIAGALVSSFLREKGFVWLEEGRKTDKYFSRTENKELPLGYVLQAGDLKQEMYGDGKSVKDWFSNLQIIRDGKVIAEKTVEVNHPLDFEGRSFYQAAWSEGYKFKVLIIDKKNGKKSSINLSVGNDLLNTEGKEKIYKISEDNTLYLRLEAFYPDFVMTDEGFATRSRELNNPAAELLVYWHGLGEAKRKVIFARFPNLDFGKMMGKGSDKEDPFHFEIEKDIKKTDVTGIEITYDPGTGIVYAGFYFVIAGLMSCFYFNHRRIWISIKSIKGHCSISITGTARRNKENFKQRLLEYSKSLKEYIIDNYVKRVDDDRTMKKSGKGKK